MLEDQALFEMAIESTKSLSVPIFKCIGKAMFLFNLPTPHARYVPDPLPQDHKRTKQKSCIEQFKSKTKQILLLSICVLFYGYGPEKIGS